MWDDILDILIEFFFELTMNWTGKGKAVLDGLTAVAWLAVAVIFLWAGITERDISLCVLGIVFLAALGLWLYVKIRKYRRKKN